MAEAGFYHVGTEKEPDLVRCYWCRRELDGWEPTDDPLEEHRRRPCAFIDLGKSCDQITIEDMLKLEGARGRYLAEKLTERRMTQCQDNADATRARVEAKGSKAKAKAKRRKR